MSRPFKKRRIHGHPKVTYFKPSGIRLIYLEEATLQADEFEALRLNDFLGLNQIGCAKQMDVSQSTFHRLISSARKKIADAIINGKAIRVEKK